MVPLHPPACGVKVIVATTCTADVFAAENAAIFPVPEAPSPMDVVLFVQVKVDPLIALVNTIGVVRLPVHAL